MTFVGECTEGNAHAQERFRDAKEMSRRGHTPASIFREKGCFQDLDGFWVSEVSDKDARMTGKLKSHGQRMRFDEAMRHDELFRARPDMARTKIEVDKKLSHAGEYRPDGTIVVRDPKNLGVAIHEGQHAAQDKDGRIKWHDSGTPYEKRNHEIEAFDVMHRRKADSGSSPDLLKKSEGKDVKARQHLAPTR